MLSSSSSWDDWFETVSLESSNNASNNMAPPPPSSASSALTRLRGDKSLDDLLRWLARTNDIPWHVLVTRLTTTTTTKLSSDSPPGTTHPCPAGPVWLRSNDNNNQEEVSEGGYCVLLGATNPPDPCSYHLDLIVTTTTTTTPTSTTLSSQGAAAAAAAEEEDNHHPPAPSTTTTTTLPVAGADAESVSGTLSKLLEWLAHSSNSNSNNNHCYYYHDVTLQAFATQPRQALPRLSLPPPSSSTCSSSSHIRALRFHFVDVTADAMAAHFWNRIAPQHVELRQCTVQDWPGLLAQLEYNNNNNDDGDESCTTTTTVTSTSTTPRTQQQQQQQLEALTISCTRPEFVQMAPCALPRNIQHLSLLLHFWLQHDDQGWWSSFCETLRCRAPPHLQTLTLQYLDITDQAWQQLLESLHHSCSSLHTLTCQFTNDFVDAHRRLTPERRTARTRAVLDLVTAHPGLCQVVWPSFQQDERVKVEINEVLLLRANNE